MLVNSFFQNINYFDFAKKPILFNFDQDAF